MLVTDLPDDILYGIFPHLTASEFVKFTSCSKVLFLHRDSTTFWHALTRKTFRVPPQPLLQGARWHTLYKKLLTQTRLYTWGNNRNGNLGRNTKNTVGGQRRGVWCSGWPRQPQLESLDVGIIADVQCGGWCTTLLNSIGNVSIFGALDGSNNARNTTTTPRKLMFPPAYPQNSSNRYEPSTAIQQFSTGRSSILGLSDDGKVWSWTSDVAALIKPWHVDIREHKVEKVVAGWERGSMYVRDVGIVYWASERESDFLDGGRQENLAVADALLIDTVTIPGTAFRRTASGRLSPDSLDARIGEVTTHIVLETHIVFITHLNKIFSYPNHYPMAAVDFTEPVELTTFLEVQDSPSYQFLDLQGAFRKFAVFTKDGSIWTADREFLDAFHDTQKSPDTPQPSLPFPTLLEQNHQQARTISIAFGDHHYHALHEDGTLTSWGTESKYCGALGLGDEGEEVMRGVNVINFGRDQYLSAEQAKTVWFEPLMEKWLRDAYVYTKSLGGVPERANERPIVEAFGDYFEKQGAKWDPDRHTGEDLSPYFVLKVAAAGWSSAALVLVDEEKADRVRQTHIIKQSPAPSEADSNAEYEYGDSPFDMVEIALSSIFGWIRRSGRYFLGLTTRDDARAEGQDSGNEAPEEVFSWSENPLPLEDIVAGIDTRNP